MEYINGAKIFNYPERLIDFRDGRPCYPITVAIHPTNRCNCKCRYCNYEWLRDDATLDYGNLATILRNLKMIGVQGINFTGGGEPLLNPYLKLAIEFAKGQGLHLGLITNGILLNQFHNYVRYFDWIRVSVDADNAEDYKVIREVDQFDRVISNIGDAVELKRELFLSTVIGTHAVVLRENIGNLIRMTQFFKDLGVDYFQFRPEERINYTETEFDLIDRTIPCVKALEDNFFQVMFSPYKWIMQKTRNRSYTKCEAAEFIGTIDPRGNWYVCCHWVGHEAFRYGNLITEPLTEIIQRRKRVQGNIDVRKCQIDCRGTMINQALHNFLNQTHVQFL